MLVSRCRRSATSCWASCGRGWIRGFLEQQEGARLAVETRTPWLPRQTLSPPEHGAPAEGAETEGPQGTPPPSPVLDDVARVLEGRMGVRPGRDCVVGDGLATVDLGLFLNGRQVAIHVERQEPGGSSHAAPGSGPAGTAAAGAAERLFAEARTKRRVLQTFGWAVATVSELEWAASRDDHEKVHVIVEAVNKALEADSGQGHHHHHHAGCGCSH